jgi:hypothetical protein
MIPESGQSAQQARAYDIAAMAMCLCVFGAVLWAGRSYYIGGLGLESDFYGSYAPIAEKILARRPFSFDYHPPGYMFMLAGLSWLSGWDMWTTGKVLGAIATAAFGAVSYAVLATIVNRRVALLGAGLALITILPFALTPSTDIPAAAVMLVPVWLLLRMRRRWALACFASGVFCAVAYLIRTNNVVLIAAMVTGLLAIGFNGDNLRRRSLKAALAFAGFVVAAIPWFISNWQTKGSPTASQHHTQVAAHFFHPQGDDWAANSAEMGEQFHSLGEVLRHDPVRMIKTYVQDMSLRYPALLASLVVGFPAMVFAGAGLLLLFVRDLTRERLFYAIPLFFSYLVLGLVGFQSRFYLFLLPTIFAAVAYFAFEGKWGPQNSRRVSGVLAWSLVLATTAVLLYESRSKVILALRSQPVEILEAAKSLSGVERGLRLAGPPHLAYQLGWTTVRLRANTAEEYLAHSLHHVHAAAGGWLAKRSGIARPEARTAGPQPCIRSSSQRSDCLQGGATG